MLLSEGYKFHVQFHITNRCNLKCRHCYEGKQGKIVEWDYHDFEDAIEKLWTCFAKWNVIGEISLIGGEPTLHPQFFEIVEYLHQRGDVDSISILTNGTNVDERFIQKMITNECSVQVSIDGSDANGHDYIRGNGTFKTTLLNSKRMSEKGIPVSAHCVLSKYTYPITEEFFDVLSSFGISQVAFSRLVPFGNAQIEDMLSPEQLRETIKFISEVDEKRSFDGLSISRTRPLWCIAGKGGRCPAGIQTITILENGDVMPCRRLPIVLGNIKHDSFYKIWYTDPVLENLRTFESIEKCSKCKYNSDCGGARCIAYAVTGDYLAPDPQCWL